MDVCCKQYTLLVYGGDVSLYYRAFKHRAVVSAAPSIAKSREKAEKRFPPFFLIISRNPSDISGFVLLDQILQINWILEFSFHSTWLLVGSWLFCIQHLPCSVTFWCLLEGSVEVWTKNLWHQFIKGQAHFGISRGSKMSLALKNLK